MPTETPNNNAGDTTRTQPPNESPKPEKPAILDVASPRGQLKEQVEERKGRLEKLNKIGSEYPGKWNNPDFKAAVIKLSDGGVEVNGWIIKYLSLEKGESKEYMQTLFDLKKGGVVVDYGVIAGLSPEKAESKEYIQGLIDLQKGGVEVNYGVTKYLSPEKAASKEYMQTLFDLKKGGVEVNGGVIEELSPGKAASKEYIQSLIDLQKGGVKVDGGVIAGLSPEKAANKEYVRSLIDLQKGGIEVYGWIIYNLSLEEAESKEYIQILFDLQKGGIGVDGEVIEYLSFEEAKSKEYIQGLIDLKKGGVKVNYGVTKYLSLEKGENREYIQGLIDLHKGGVKVDGWFIKDLSFEKTVNKEYIQILIHEKTIAKADNKYLAVVQKLTSEEADDVTYGNFRSLFAIKNKYKLDNIGFEIVQEAMTDSALYAIREINNLHESSNEVRHAVIKGLPLEAYFQLAAHGKEELFTSSFRSVLYPLLMKKMKEDGMDAVDFIEEFDSDHKYFRSILALFSKYDRLEELLDTIKDPKKKEGFLKRFIYGLEADRDGTENGVAIAETLFYMRKNKDLNTALEGYVYDAHNKASGNEKLLYGVIASVHEHNAHTNKDFFKKMNEKYPVKHMYSLGQNELVNKDNEIIQQVFFYNDEDGVGSYNNMIKYYRGKSGWELEDNKTWILLKKKVGKYTILKYVNKPKHVDEGAKGIKEAMKKKDLSAIQIVHRGHSYHVAKTLEHIPHNAKIVFLGSCGGFNNVNAVLNKAKNSHIIATKGTGSKYVNDPLLLMLDQHQLKGDGIVWNELWEQAERNIKSKYFPNYINPANNTSVQFINAYRKFEK